MNTKKTACNEKAPPAPKTASLKWNQQKEVKGGYYGLKIVLTLYKLLGNRMLKPLLYVIIFFYYLNSSKQRRISRQFLDRVETMRQKHHLKDEKLSSFKHFLSFGLMLLDKMRAWQGDLHLNQEVCFKKGSYENFYKFLNQGQGKIFICSHLGNVEALRAVGSHTKERSFEVYSVVFTKNAENFSRFTASINHNSRLNRIATDEITPKTSIFLQEKISEGHAVAIVADRIPTNYESSSNKQRVTCVDFLGEKTLFPQGAFILAAVLKCPVQLLFGLRNETTGKIEIVCEDFQDKIVLTRTNRDEELKKMVTEYARILEYHTLEHPYEWFNFY